MSWSEVEAELVRADRWSRSTTRAGLWDELSMHVELVRSVVGQVSRIWLAGSFVSGKLDPCDIDLAYLIAPEALDSIRTDEASIDYLDNLGRREWCVKQDMRVDAYMLRLPSTADFRALGIAGAMVPGDDEVFQQLGLYDEIWQRCRAGGGTGRRGYVEVTL
ncbi:hypothetical protein [Streptomyces sp. S4.7]|uniref:DUF6932 family protein n=1 Tax=Streptomyces sp. S4.7 TaxID=2705439 RepID=UPI0013D935B0|nr:hypothetical protein [Streptomyces sp. S4.7]